MEQLTLNQIKNKLKGWFEAHKQINSVFYLNKYDYASERSIEYPSCDIVFNGSNLNEGFSNHQFDVTLADKLLEDNNEIEDNIISDSMSVAEDFFTWLYSQPEWDFLRSTAIQPFSDANGDITAGINFIITLAVTRKQNRCDTPVK